KLDGVDRDWSPPSDQRTVQYARLTPGAYRLLVRAVNRAGATSPEPAMMAFRILPPVWRRGWFIALGALAAGMGLYALYRYRVARLIELERVRTRIATDLHDDIGSSLSRITLLSEVIKQQMGEGPPGLRALITEVAETARALTGTMSDIVWAIDPRRDD